MTMVSDTNDVYSNDDAPTFSSIYYGYSEEVRNLIKIRAGLYQENSNFHNSTWNLFRENILNWKMSNKGWNDVNHKNFHEELAEVRKDSYPPIFLFGQVPVDAMLLQLALWECLP